MPVNPTYPGVYIEEIPSGVRTIRGVATSVAVFIGTFDRGLHNEAVRVQSLSEFEREYGGISRNSEASYSVQQFFLNGGTEAWIIRIGHPGPTAGSIVQMTPATVPLEDTVGGGGNTLLDATAGRVIRDEPADNPGGWGNNLRLEVTYSTTSADTNFNLAIKEVLTRGDLTTVVREEVFRNLTMQPFEPNNAIEVVNAGSQMVYLSPNFATPTDEDQPHTTGTLGGDLAAGVPVVADIIDLAVTLTFPDGEFADIGPIALDFADITVAPATHPAWAALFQERLRRTAQDTTANVPLAFRPYLAGAVVTLLGHGTATEPYRFHIRAGQGGRPFIPSAVLVFGDSAPGGNPPSANYGLAPAGSGPAQGSEVIHEGPQQLVMENGDDGSVVDPATGAYQIPAASFTGNPGQRTGLYALEDVDLFNVLCMPDAPRLGDTGSLAVYGEALNYVAGRRAMMIVDIPQGLNRIDQMETWLGENASLRAPNTAVYFPRTFNLNSLNQNRPRSFASSGTIAGLWARTDAQRGVWKAPAGTDARLRAVRELVYTMTDPENGVLNPLGVNCLRQFPIYGSVCWGARTLDGADQIASDWKYVPVRRTTLFIEESLYRGTKWVVFEPNDEPLWAQIRLNVGAFMHDLFRQGAFQGTMPQDAYRVKCDAETTTQTDIDNGIVNIEVAFAPLKPAEFVILKIQQIARRADS